MTNNCYRLIHDFYKTTCDICGKEIIGGIERDCAIALQQIKELEK